MIAGHRGALALAPENTLAGFQKAVESNAKWIEVDTQLSADNVAIIFHDESVERTTNGQGKVADLTINQLNELDAGSWFSEDFIDEKIPTLQQSLLFCMQNDLNMNLEIKIHHAGQVKALVEKIVEVIYLTRFPIENLILSSFSTLALKQCQKLMPEIRLGYITEDDPQPLLEEIKAINLYSMHLDYKILNQQLASTLIQLGYKLVIWTMNDPLQTDKYKHWGVNMIITDKPNLFTQY